MQSSSEETQLHDSSGLIGSIDLHMGTSLDEFFGTDFSFVTYLNDMDREAHK